MLRNHAKDDNSSNEPGRPVKRSIYIYVTQAAFSSNHGSFLSSLLGVLLIILLRILLGSHPIAGAEQLLLGRVLELLGQVSKLAAGLQRSGLGLLLRSLLRVRLVVFLGILLGRHPVTGADQLLALVQGGLAQLLGQVRDLAASLQVSRLLSGLLGMLLVVFLGVLLGSHAVAAEQLLALVLGQVPELLGNVPDLAASFELRLRRRRLALVVTLGVKRLVVPLGGGGLDHDVAGEDVVVVVVETAGLAGGAGGQERGGEDRGSEGCGHGESELHGEWKGESNMVVVVESFSKGDRKLVPIE
ncbi:hypothetical protein PG985_011261 [Apiospora marii]|uniref:Uncharacterized protein n=1 Tax=Apiospora marii TaxID=335849 RepID=A0ABR1ST67_9PEZI